MGRWISGIRAVDGVVADLFAWGQLYQRDCHKVQCGLVKLAAKYHCLFTWHRAERYPKHRFSLTPGHMFMINCRRMQEDGFSFFEISSCSLIPILLL
ncbi:hypothetical protein RQP50_27280 [Paenibacillus sp. chi10]|uniref:Uncharacterized protein n=1 Tax=Paenibacillus suaedae TaxID=3077233 RepID=A0AAJ2JZU2_9BACL|nr:hypothetical protein [Paenibacillus sp. chi10]MDT8979945.1 hypothetical protein [Paenibacillus sp. chi10]